VNVPNDIAKSVIDSLKTSPFLLALITINVIALIGFAFVINEISNSMERREAWVKYCLEKKG
jgi:hypothetical protein